MEEWTGEEDNNDAHLIAVCQTVLAFYVICIIIIYICSPSSSTPRPSEVHRRRETRYVHEQTGDYTVLRRGQSTRAVIYGSAREEELQTPYNMHSVHRDRLLANAQRSSTRSGGGSSRSAADVWMQRNYITRIPIHRGQGGKGGAYYTPGALHQMPASPTYEVSDELRQHHINAIERRYGGRQRAHLAAIVIQRAYRRYIMQRTWQTQVRNRHSSTASTLVGKLPLTSQRTFPPMPPSVSVRHQQFSFDGQPPVPMKHVTDSPRDTSFYSQSMDGQSVTPEHGGLHRHHPTAPSLTPQLRTKPQAIHRIAVRPIQKMATSASLSMQQRQRSMSTERVIHRHPPPQQQQPHSQVLLPHPSSIVAPRILGVDELLLCNGTASSSSNSVHSPPHYSEASTTRVDEQHASSSGGEVWTKQSSPPLRHPSSSPKVSVGGYTQQQRTLYRVALNYFNKKPERGMQLLMTYGFVENDASAVASFLVQRRGLSKQMIGEYLGTYVHPTSSATAHTFYITVLQCFASQFDLCGVEVDEALRRFLAAFRPPGEAQKIERIMQAFAKRYVECNKADPLNLVNSLCNSETVYVLAFAIIMLNTDLHNSNVKQRMSLDAFVRNLRGIDDGHDIDVTVLEGIYGRIRADQFRPGHDHVSQVVKVDNSIVGKTKPILPASHRRLVCYCRLVEVIDAHKRQPPTQHVRDVFLFNDLIVVTKSANKKKSPLYTYRESYPLQGLQVQSFKTEHYPYGIKLNFTLVGKELLLNAKNDKDRVDFTRDLLDSSMEADQMEKLRIDVELGKQSMMRNVASMNATAMGGFAGDVTLVHGGEGEADITITPNDSHDMDTPRSSARLSQRALSSSMLNVCLANEGASNSTVGQPLRRASVNSFDSGMSSTASVESNKERNKIKKAMPAVLQ